MLRGRRALLRRARSTDDVPKQTEQNVQVEGLLERSVALALPGRGAVLKLPAIGGADDDGRGAEHGVLLEGGEHLQTCLRRLHAEVKDPNFRIFTDRTTITVFNHELFVRGTDIQEIFAQLGVDEATHAFYLGRELAKAKLAITLGKTYRQEGALSWGYLTPPDEVRSEHVKLTQRRRRPDAPAARRDQSR